MGFATDVADLTATEMLTLFKKHELSPVEAAKSALARIWRFNPVVNAFCHLDEERTLDAARQAEDRYMYGAPRGQLDGVPVAIKDVFMVRGWPNLKGSLTIDPEERSMMDAPAISALVQAGYVPLGKTTTPEFGWKGVTDSPLTGVTRNPWNPELTAGGSSGGSAAALPLGMGPIALGTDAGGSIRIPAGFSGLVGFKPTHGRIPLWPGSPFGFLAHPGPMARTVEDAALLMNVLSRPDPRDPTLPGEHDDYLEAIKGELTGLPIAYSPNLGYATVDRRIEKSVKQAAELFQDLGAVIEEVDPGFTDPADSFNRLFFGGAANLLHGIPSSKYELMDPALVSSSIEAGRMSVYEYMSALNERASLVEKTSLFHQKYRLLLTPTLPIPAFTAGREVPEHWSHQRWPTWTPFTFPFNMTGQPAASVPCGFTEEGVPIGLQIIGARHQDTLVLRAAHQYQRAKPLYRMRPPLLEDDSSQQRSHTMH